MRGISTTMFVLVALLSSIVLATADQPQKAELTRRQSDIGDKRFSTKSSDLQKKNALTDKRMPIKMWHAEFNALGQRRAPIDVGERRDKNMIRPQVIDVDKKDRKMASQSRRMAYVRNFDQVRERNLVPAYRDAEVVTERELSRPAPSNKHEELTMRDLNRFSFQRNHPGSGGARVDKAASEEKK